MAWKKYVWGRSPYLKHFVKLREHKTRSSKYPSAFGIDIDVDDSPGLKIDGEKFNFRTIIIDDHDATWVDTILNRVNQSS